jgi:hypothetical protein
MSPATTSAWRMCRCSNSTSINARVPAESPSRARAAAQNASCAAVNPPDWRAWASAVEPGKRAGFAGQHLQIVIQQQQQHRSTLGGAPHQESHGVLAAHHQPASEALRPLGMGARFLVVRMTRAR